MAPAPYGDPGPSGGAYWVAGGGASGGVLSSARYPQNCKWKPGPVVVVLLMDLVLLDLLAQVT